MPKKIIILAALLSSKGFAQYVRGDEIPLRPTPPSADEIGKTMSLEEYIAAEALKKSQPQNTTNPTLTNHRPSSLPIEKLTPPSMGNNNQPPPGKTQTIVVEQAIFRCEKGNNFVFVDEDNKNKFSRCVLFRAEKTAEVPIELPPAQPVKPLNACTGTLFYQGNTYIFNDHEPCPIPENILRQLLPVATPH